MTPELRQRLAALVPERALPGALTTDADLFRLELDRIFAAGWLFVALSAELADPGDLVTLELGDWSVLVVRGGDSTVRAFHNVCRHRGMRLVASAESSVLTFVCPYHQWTYGLDGRLRGCGGMDRGEGLDRAAHGLLAIPVEVVGGLVFIALHPTAPAFAMARRALGDALAPQGLDHARVAAERHWSVAADWKLLWENNRECWHCVEGHPTYVRANYDTLGEGDSRRRAALAARLGEMDRELRGSGLDVQTRQGGLHPFPTAGCWWAVNRTALTPGFVTESADGGPVAPLMGAYTAPNVGTLRVRTLPNFWCHASGDHAVVTRLLPRGPGRTDVRVQWVVDREARAGVDFDVGRLMAFWLRTSEEDWSLCERAQLGMRSPACQAGPLSRRWEANVIALHEWYRAILGGDGPAASTSEGG